MKGLNPLLRPALWVGLIGVLGKVMGAFGGILLAYRFGAGQSTDAYLLAKTLPIAVFLIFDSVIYNTLVPLLRRREESDVLFRTLLALFFFGAILVAAAVYFGATQLVPLLARGADVATQEEAAHLQRITAWAIVYAVPGSCLKAWNAAHSRYVAAALDGFVISGILLFVLLVTPDKMGITPVAIALPVAFFILLCIQGGLGHGVLQLRGSTPLRELPGTYLARLMGPLLLLNAAQQAQILLVVVLASFYGSGAVSQVNYSYAIAQIPVGILDLILFSTLFPFAAKLAADRKLDALRKAHQNASMALMMLAVPIALWMVLSRADLVGTLLARGLFDTDDAQATAALLFGHAISIPAWVLEALGCRVLFALGLHRHYLGVALIRLVTFSMLAPLCLGVFGLPGLSLAFAASFIAGAFAVSWMVQRAVPQSSAVPRKSLIRFVMLLATVSLLTLATTQTMQWGLHSMDPVYHLLVGAILTAIIVFGGIRVLVAKNYVPS